tara:strand:- start:324 stop:875 length:552 start_codon:yes stop_codon:yes gene_type:complete
MSRIIVDSIRNSSASSDGITLSSDGKVTFPNTSTGKILQVVTGTALGTASTTSTSSMGEITTDLRCTITPISASSKIIVTANLYLSIDNQVLVIRILKDGTTMVNTPTGFTDGDLDGNNCATINGEDFMWSQIVQVIETAGSTASRYYSPFWKVGSGTGYLNRWYSSNIHNSTSTMTVMEIAA